MASWGTNVEVRVVTVNTKRNAEIRPTHNHICRRRPFGE